MKALVRHFGVARTGLRCLSSALWDVLGGGGGRVFNSGEQVAVYGVSPHWFRCSDTEEKE